MFIKILTKTYKGEQRYYASLVENKRVNGKVEQTVKANGLWRNRAVRPTAGILFQNDREWPLSAGGRRPPATANPSGAL